MLKKFTLIPILLLIALAPAYTADYYWVGGSGDWTDINHWAKTSGGSVNYLQAPTASDNVIFDANSFSSPGQTVNLNSHTISCKDFIVDNADSVNFQGINHTFNIHGSLDFQKSMNWPSSTTLNFNSKNQGNIIYPAEHEFSKINFKGIGGEWSLEGPLEASEINLTQGTLNFNNHTVAINNFKSITSNTRSLELGSSQISISSQFSILGPNISVSPGTSEIILSSGDPNKFQFKVHNTPDLSFYDITLKGKGGGISTESNLISFHDIEYFEDGRLSGNHNIHDLILHNGINLSVAQGYTKTFSGDIKPNGSCVKNTAILSSGTTTFSKNSGTIDIEYVKLENIHATGGATFNAQNSKDLGNNTGWNFTSPNPRTLYWVNSTGVWHDTTNWSLSSGGPSGECPPTQYDNVIIDQNSGNCGTISYGASPDTIAKCHDLTWQKNTACPMTMTGNYTLEIHGSLDLDDDVDLTTEQVIFRSSDMGETIKTGNVIFTGNVVFDGSGGWTLQDSLKRENNANQAARISFQSGNLNTNGQYITTPRFWANKVNPRVLTLNNSTIDVWQDSSWIAKQDSLTINPGTSEINLRHPESKMYNIMLGGVEYHNVNFKDTLGELKLSNDDNTQFNKVTFNSNALIKGAGVFDSLMLSQDRIYDFQGGYPQTINNHLGAKGGCEGWITMKSHSIDDTATIVSSSGSISVENVLMMRVAASGGANFLANNSADKGGNPGWTFTSPSGQDHYWVGGPGNWSDTSHWSYSSGGPGGACLPTPFDNVYFDNNSFNATEDTVTIDCFNAYSKDMDWSNVTLNPVIIGKENKRLRIFGSLTLTDSSAMNFDYEGETFFSSKNQGNTIYSGKNEFNNDVIFEGVFGGWSLSDTLFVDTDANVSFLVGHLNLNNKGLITGKFISTHSRTKSLDISSSYMEIKAGGTKNQGYNMKCDSLTLNHSNSLIELSANNAWFYNSGTGNIIYDKILFSNTDSITKSKKGKIQTFNPNVKYNKVTFLNNGKLFGPNKFDTLIFSPSRTYVLESSELQTIVNQWEFNSDCNNYIKIHSDSDNVQANILKINGDVNGSYLQLKDLNAIANVNYNANQSFDLGNNTGWNISPTTPLQLYWVNGEGDWFDPAHWSYSSGGSGGACIPTKKDNVYFDANSFPNDSSKTVTDTNNISYPLLPVAPESHDMDWTNADYNPIFDVKSINIYGSLTLIDSMKSSLARVSFNSDTTGETITTAGDTFNNVYFKNGGEWTLLDSLKIENKISLMEGNLNTNSQTVLCDKFISTIDKNRSLSLDNSDIYVSREWKINGTNFTLNPGQSTLFLIDTTTSKTLVMDLENGGQQKYNNVSFKHPGGNSLLRQKQVDGVFNKLSFEGDAKISGKSISDTLVFRPGYTYSLDHTETQRIYDHWQVRGNNCFYINLESTSTNQQAKVKKNGSDVLGDYINMQDIKALGTATFYAGDFSDDVSNNDNWIFQNGPNYVYGLPDTTYLQLGGTVTLHTINFNGTPSTEYQWSTGSTADSIVVDSTAWYYITVTYANDCVVEDSTFVACDLNLDFTTKSPTCHGGNDGYAEVLIPDSSASYEYFWETGDTTKYINNQPSGKYSIEVLANGLCGAYDSVTIPQTPPIEIPLNDTAFCEGDTLRLDAGSGFKAYLWGDSLTQQYRLVSKPDTFTVSVKDYKDCWSDFDTVVVTEDKKPDISLGPDTSLCLHETEKLQVLKGCDKYLWSTGNTTYSIHADEVGEYWVKVWRGACTATDTISFYHCEPDFKIPNVFTPNGDGYNDRFIPETQNIIDFEMIIYNRWGKKVFMTQDMQNGWDGKINGQPAAEGTYFYVIHYRLYGGSKHGRKKSISGEVTLLR
ncbi:MAG: gliding motility-associated C-terminal domain-containing protein [Bacteroidales bacterium]